MYIFEGMTMEETFLVTYIGCILLTVLIALPIIIIFEKDERKR